MAGAAPLCLEGEKEDGLRGETPSAPAAEESPQGWLEYLKLRREKEKLEP